MNWGNLKYMLNQMTPAQLEEPALVYHAHYDRLFPVGACDHMRNLSTKKRSGDPIALFMEREPVND